MQDKTTNYEIIKLLDELEKDINNKINMYNYYIDVIVDRFPPLGDNPQFKKKEIQEFKDEEKNRRI